MSCTVIGAGVIGLSCAIALCEHGYNVKVIAKHLPSDSSSEYTSPLAGAHFRPYPSKTPQDQIEMKMTRITQEYFRKLSESDPHSSIRFVEGIEYLESPDKLYSSLAEGYTEDMDNFHKLDILPEGTTLGTTYTTWVLNPPYYLRYLEQKLQFHYGVKFERQELASLKEAAKQNPGSIIINCSGRGLQYNGEYDPHVYLIRGQTLLLRVEPDCPYLHKTVTHQSKEGLWTFIVPRPLDGGVILGGTKQLNDTETSAKQEDTNAITDRARKLYPELFINGELDIRKINVGFRPARHGGVRTEIQQIDGVTIVHAYGTGGMGYELSYGMGITVLRLIRSLVQL